MATRRVSEVRRSLSLTRRAAKKLQAGRVGTTIVGGVNHRIQFPAALLMPEAAVNFCKLELSLELKPKLPRC